MAYIAKSKNRHKPNCPELGLGGLFFYQVTMGAPGDKL